MPVKIIVSLILVLYLTNCATMLTKNDYKPAEKAFEKWDIQAVIDAFPDKERGSFITIMEKTYLNLLAGRPDIDELATFAYDADNQIRFKASRELKSFFYQETPEGYYASEHEIIWLHLLLGWGYSIRGDYEKAYVEAKICSNLLSGKWSEEGRFDDPLMRVILAAVWTMCGEWEEAQVDFRAAYKLDPSVKWAKQLADLNIAPRNLVVILGGIGQEPEWDPNLKSNLIRGFRGIKFNPRGVRSRLVLKDSGKFSSNMDITPDSSYWYKRHFIRDNEIQDLIQDTRYAQRAAGSAAKGTLVTSAGIVGGILVATGGIGLGVGIMILGAYANSGELFMLGFVPMGAGLLWGYKIAKDSYNYSKREFKREMDPSKTYRFVRFLPEYAWVGWSMKKLKEPVTIFKNEKPLLTSKQSNLSTVNIVSIGFYPDASGTPAIDSPRHAFGRVEDINKKDKRGNTRLHSAIEANKIDEIKDIIEKGADIDILNSDGFTPLHTAIKLERAEIVELLIKSGANINKKDKYDNTPLNTTVIFELPEYVRYLIKSGADVNLATEFGWAPLHNAVFYNNIEITRILLQNGADVNAVISRGYRQYPVGSTPLKIAQINNNSEIIQLLKMHGAKK